MVKNKWLFISFVVFIVVITCGIGLDCNFLGVKDWRGIKAALLGLFFALGIVIPALVFLFQFVKIYGLSTYGRMGLVLIPLFVFIYASTIVYLSKQYCN
jgi:hypothetical protein